MGEGSFSQKAVFESVDRNIKYYIAPLCNLEQVNSLNWGLGIDEVNFCVAPFAHLDYSFLLLIDGT